MKNFAHLKKDSPFYSIFDSGLAPIVNIIMPSNVRLEGSDETEAYMLDVKKCSHEQIEQIAKIISLKFDTSPDAVLQEMNRRGLPIRASQVESVSTDVRAFL